MMVVIAYGEEAAFPLPARRLRSHLELAGCPAGCVGEGRRVSTLFVMCLALSGWEKGRFGNHVKRYSELTSKYFSIYDSTKRDYCPERAPRKSNNCSDGFGCSHGTCGCTTAVGGEPAVFWCRKPRGRRLFAFCGGWSIREQK